MSAHMHAIENLGIIAGNGDYPLLLAQSARAAGVKRIVTAAFENETRPSMADISDEIQWLRVGQLGRLIDVFASRGVTSAIMAGQIAPSNLFDLRPDWKALTVLTRLKRRNAESIFNAIGEELAAKNVTLLDARTFMESEIAGKGFHAGPRLKARVLDDVAYGYAIAKESSRLDIGQTVVVKNGTVLAVEAFEGTNEAIKRGGALGRGGAIVVKVAKPRQDFRFDVPVIGEVTLRTAKDAGITTIAVEAETTLLLNRKALIALASEFKISLLAHFE